MASQPILNIANPQRKARPVRPWLWLLLAFGSVLPGLSISAAGLWTTAYYPGYRQTYLPPSAIDFNALTHIIHFSVLPNVDGTLNSSANGITPSRVADLIAHAHTAGRKVLICVGGANSQVAFRGATGSGNLSNFVFNLTQFVTAQGYDGVDLDWEPLEGADAGQFTNLVLALHSALAALSPQRLLSAATASQPALFAALQARFDQINLMTYDLAGPWPGWVTWFNSPIFDGGYRFPSTGSLVPSANGMVNDFLAAGVASGKLGIGLAFYGNLWTGGTGTSTGGAAFPRQGWATPPTNTQVAFFDIMANYFQSNLYHWDTNAQAAYLSVDAPGGANDRFISYDDEHTCQAKVSFARNRFLGGIMIWELGQGYRAGQPAGQQAPLLEAVRQALETPSFDTPRIAHTDVQLSFTSLPLAFYRVEWTTNSDFGLWNTLTSGVSGTGGSIQVIDPGAVSSGPQRFYRVKTPP